MNVGRGLTRIRLCLAGVLAAALMAIAAPGASAAPFQCDAYGYLFQAPSGAPGLVQQIDLATGAYSTAGTTADVINAVGYNTLDNYFYAWDVTTSNMVRVNDDFSLTPVTTPAALPATVVGDFDDAGHYWAWTANTLYEIDYAPGSPTYGQIVHTAPSTVPAGLSDAGLDHAWINGFLYSVGFDASTEAHLVRTNPTTGAKVDLTPSGLGYNTTASGAVYADASGYLYASDNSTGEIHRINPTTLQAIQLPTASAAGSNDGARCAEAPIPTVTVKKVVDGRVRPADQFKVALVNPAGSEATSETTSGTTTSASTVDWPVSQGKTYTITDAMAAGSGTPLGEYVKSIHCVDGAGNPVSTGGSVGSWTLNIATPTAYTCTVTNKAAADLTLDKTSSSSPAIPGTNQAYTLKLTNNGPSTAINAKVADPLPAGLTFVSASAGCSFASGTVTCSAGDLAPGAEKTFTVTARVNSDLPAGTLNNTATATTDTPDPNPSNNTDGHTDPVEPRADLVLAKTASTTKLTPGKNLTYQLLVTNDGPSDAKDVKVSDPLPKGLTFVSASAGCAFASGTVTCTAASLAVHKSITFEVVTKVASSVTDKVVNTATVESTTKDPDPSNNTDGAQVPSGPQADLSIDKVPSVDRVNVGAQLFYTLVIKNHGPSDATKVVVTDNAGPGLTLASAQPSKGTCTVTATKVTCDVGTVPAGGTAQVLVSARADQPGELTNSARVDSPTEDPDPKNNEEIVKVTGDPAPPQTPADLDIVKTSNKKSLTGAGTITYTLTVANKGPGAATGTQVIDTPSLRVKVSSAKPSVGACTKTLPITCDLGTLQSGAKVTIKLVVQPLAAGPLKNSASVTGDVPDPNTDNNIDGASTSVQGLLKVSKVASRSSVAAGGTLSYKIRVTNASAFALKSVKVCDDLPSGLIYVSSDPKAKLSSGKYCWTIATLGAKKSRSIALTARALSGANGRKVNVATATAPNARGATSKAATDTVAIRVLGEQARGGGVTG